MVTDWYPDEEGSIVDGLICGFCYADGAIAEGDVVTWGTSASGRVAVKAGVAVGDGIGVALKAASGAGVFLPVAFSGIVKLTVDETLSIGALVISQSSIALVGMGLSNTLYINSATQMIIGCLMQESTDESDEVLTLLGGDGISAGNI